MKGRLPKPTAQLVVAGTWREDRHGKRPPEPAGAVGEPPRGLSAVERRAWREVVEAASWLTAADRSAVELYSRLKAMERVAFAEMSATQLSSLIALHSRLGLTPTDRGRVQVPEPEPAEVDPAERFFKPKSFDA